MHFALYINMNISADDYYRLIEMANMNYETHVVYFLAKSAKAFLDKMSFLS